MPITAHEAADIARQHGLTLMDAAGLASMADDVADADRIARRFSGTDPEAMRGYAAQLFGRTGDPEQPTATDSTPTPGGNDELRQFVQTMFNPDNA